MSAMSKQACVTLQRPPPDTFTFDSILFVFSNRITSSIGFIRAALTAQKNPAAPPPITTSRCCIDSKYIKEFNHRSHGLFFTDLTDKFFCAICAFNLSNLWLRIKPRHIKKEGTPPSTL